MEILWVKITTLKQGTGSLTDVKLLHSSKSRGGDYHMKRSAILVFSLWGKRTGLTKSVNYETSLFLAVKVSFRMHLKN